MSNMKLLLVIIFVSIYLVESQRIGEKLKDYAEQCRAEFNIDEKLLQEILYFSESDSSENVKCFINCIGIKSGLIRPNAEFDAARTKQILGELADEKFMAMTNNCFAEHNTKEKCGRLYDVRHCVVKALGLKD